MGFDGTDLTGGRLEGIARKLLASPRLPLYLVAGLMTLGLPSLERGFDGDDSMQRVWLLGRDRYPSLDPALFHSRPVVDLHVSIDPRANARQMDVGVLPWWTMPQLKVSCLRLLTAFTHWLDHSLWPESAGAMHFHSLLWAAFGVMAAASLYRRILSPYSAAVAGLAACLFALDNAPWTSAYTITFRNALVAFFLGVLCIHAHVRGRVENWRPAAVLAPVLLAGSLFAAEVGIASLAYVCAHAVFVDRGTPWERMRALVPYGVVVVLWQVVYVGMGFGVYGSSAYLNPSAEPLRFLGAVLGRGPYLLLGQWIDLDLMIGLLGEGRKLSVVAVAAALVVGAVLLPLLRRDPIARFWALGMLLCLLPLCAVVTSGRRLLFAGLGAAGLLAQLFASSLKPPVSMSLGLRATTGVVCVFLAVSRLLLGPLLLFLKAQPSPDVTDLARIPLDYTVERQTLVVLNPPNAVATYWLPYVQAVDGKAVPLRLRGLAASASSGTAARLDERTLAVRVKGGYLTRIEDTVFRDPLHPLKPGDRIELAGLVVEVASVKEDGRPWEVRFRFDVPLEHPSLRWLQWKGRAYAPFRPPGLAESVEFTTAGT